MKPLSNCQVIITRAPHQSDAFAQRLSELGAKVVFLPCIHIEPPEDWGPVDEAIEKLKHNYFHQVIFTSQNGVNYFFNRFTSLHHYEVEFAAVGNQTAAALTAYLDKTPVQIPKQFDSEHLSALLSNCRGKKILIPQGNLARPELKKTLQEQGAEVSTVTTYRTVKPFNSEAGSFISSESSPAFLTFLSPSAVDNYIELYGLPAPRLYIACIGSTTAEAAHQQGVKVHIVPKKASSDALIEALVAFYNGQ